MLADEIPSKWRDLHTPFVTLYDLVRIARNAAMHEGSFARYLTTRAVELAIILEDSFMKYSTQISDFMVKSPVCAYSWQPLSFIRQSMLMNSFSYLPVYIENGNKGWHLIADLEIAQHLRKSKDRDELRARLDASLEKAVSDGINLLEPKVCEPSVSTAEALEGWNGNPILVKSKQSNDLLGILTPFDLL